MTTDLNKGAAFLLKIKDGDTYSTVAGLRVDSFAINGEAVASTHKDAGQWRELISGAGVRAVSIEATGIFLGSDAENAIRGNALSGTVDPYELSFEDGSRLRGNFLVMKLNFAGDFNGERNYFIHLESSGEVVPV